MAVNKGFKDRRRGPDVWLFLLRIFAIVGWVVFVAAMLVSHYAVPEQSYGLVRYHNIQIRDFWAYPMTHYLYVMLWGNALLTFVTIAINHYRSRRKTDVPGFNSLLLLLITFAWIIYLSVNIK
jgi:hypothetical protein